MTIEKRIAALLESNAFAASGGSRLRALSETIPCSRCHRPTRPSALLPCPDGTEVCPICDEIEGHACEYDHTRYQAILAAYNAERLAAERALIEREEARRSAAWDRWAHRLTLLGFGIMGSLILILLYKNTIGGHE